MITHEASGHGASGPDRSGIRVAASRQPNTAAAVAEARAGLGDGPFDRVLVFFSPDHDAATLARTIAVICPDLPVSGCMTAGEIGPDGFADGSILMVGFPTGLFRVHAALIPDLDGMRVEAVGDVVRSLKAQLATDRPRADGVFALVMIDGLTNAEEMLVAAIHCAIDDIPMVGGSAGDGLAFRRSAIVHDGVVWERSALLMMVETEVPFAVFKTSNFEPTAIKLVVTAADTTNRLVHELNAEPAAREYAAAIGLLPDDLGPFSFASYPLVVKVGGDYYCRSIRNMTDDGSLAFFCAIDEGLVFTVARPKDLVASAEATLRDVETRLGGIDIVLGFDCILRRLDAQNRQVLQQVDRLYRRYRVVGFQTYGEQFNAMHLNQTLTGIAFGHARPVP
jgi:hypothetical protein